MPDLPPLTREVTPLPRRDLAAHKGTSGRVTLLGGSYGMSGAAVLAGHGALRSGAGLVQLLTPGSLQPFIASQIPCAMVRSAPSEDDTKQWSQRLDKQVAVGVGPGLGGSHALTGLVLDHFNGPTVLDADALNWLGEQEHASLDAARHILTPHAGEARRLLPTLDFGDDEVSRHSAAHQIAAHYNAVVVLKGPGTIVAAPDRSFANSTGNPGMATGGMGDVLTGIITALLGQGLGTFDAARLAVRVHGSAADRAASEIGPVGYFATDVADRIPKALAEVCRW